MSPRVYGWRGARVQPRGAAPLSTISPAYMIAIRCANSISSERSCVMKRTAKPKSRCRSCDLLEDLALHDDVERRRRLVHDHELGLSASAIAMITRCRMPPESSCGYARTRRRSMPTSSSSSPARASAARLRDALVRAHHVDELVADAHDGVERVHRALEDHRDVPPAVAAQLVAALADEILAAEEDAAAA